MSAYRAEKKLHMAWKQLKAALANIETARRDLGAEKVMTRELQVLAQRSLQLRYDIAKVADAVGTLAEVELAAKTAYATDDL